MLSNLFWQVFARAVNKHHGELVSFRRQNSEWVVISFVLFWVNTLGKCQTNPLTIAADERCGFMFSRSRGLSNILNDMYFDGYLIMVVERVVSSSFLDELLRFVVQNSPGFPITLFVSNLNGTMLQFNCFFCLSHSNFSERNYSMLLAWVHYWDWAAHLTITYFALARIMPCFDSQKSGEVRTIGFDQRDWTYRQFDVF